MAQLLVELRSGDPVRREAAVARLRVAGTRATDALTGVVHGDDTAETRAAALNALEGIDDPHNADTALPALTDPDTAVVSAAIGVLRQWLTREHGTQVLEALTTVALDGARDAAVRLSALDALGQLPRHLVGPVLEQAALGTPPAPADDPAALQEWLAANADAPLSQVHALIVRLRDEERREPSVARQEDWRRVRGAAHALLASRRSTVALYDLREALDAATTPLPLDYLAAVTAIGDVSCLEPLARAWTSAANETWWRERLSDAASAIMRRSRLTKRHTAVKRLGEKFPGFL